MTDKFEIDKRIIKLIILIMIGIFLINIINAYPITIEIENWEKDSFAGETAVNTLKVCQYSGKPQEINLSFIISNNKYNLDGINFSLSKTNFLVNKCEEVNFIIESVPNLRPDRYTITFIASGEWENTPYIQKINVSNIMNITHNWIINKYNQNYLIINITFMISITLVSISILIKVFLKKRKNERKHN
jgi:hypothetical protein